MEAMSKTEKQQQSKAKLSNLPPAAIDAKDVMKINMAQEQKMGMEMETIKEEEDTRLFIILRASLNPT